MLDSVATRAVLAAPKRGGMGRLLLMIAKESYRCKSISTRLNIESRLMR
jgi:hypothetical protein